MPGGGDLGALYVWQQIGQSSLPPSSRTLGSELRKAWRIMCGIGWVMRWAMTVGWFPFS